ncbi:hypothetical protein RCZ04_05690 [Capnocytophaga sp. HP1101]
MLTDRTRSKILFSCTGSPEKNYDSFVEDHAICYVLNGMMTIHDGVETTDFRTGEIAFIAKNQLLKVQKHPDNNQPFMSVTVFLPKEMLFSYSKENNLQRQGIYTGKPNFVLQRNPFLKGYFQSMTPYFEDEKALNERLEKLKTFELIELLIRDIPLQNLLFNFEDTYKIDLEAYMNRYYAHNIPLEKFAQLTGRSLSTFKRDFQEIFGETPNKWLVKKRLELAYYLLSSQKAKPSDVYLDAGFVNFSHFSRIFKETFGKTPSEVVNN